MSAPLSKRKPKKKEARAWHISNLSPSFHSKEFTSVSLKEYNAGIIPATTVEQDMKAAEKLTHKRFKNANGIEVIITRSAKHVKSEFVSVDGLD